MLSDKLFPRASALGTASVIEHLRRACAPNRKVLTTRPGVPVDVLMPRDLPLRNNALLVAEKTDGESVLIVCVPSSQALRTSVFAVDRSMRVFSLGTFEDAALASATSGKLAVLEGELTTAGSGANACACADIHVFDVVVFNNNACTTRGFLARFRHAVVLVPALDALCKLFDIGVAIRFLLKPFYALASGPWLTVRSCADQTCATDGLVFIDANGTQPYKWKPVHAVTSDFHVVGSGSLHAESERLFAFSTADTHGSSLSSASCVKGAFGPRIGAHIGELTQPAPPRPDTDGGTFCVAECRLLASGLWEFVTWRSDKRTANSHFVIKRNVDIVAANMTSNALFGCDSTLSPSAVDAEHARPSESAYFANPAPALGERDTPSLCMRNFHNHVVKDGAYATLATQHGYILEIACGRGADFNRLAKYNRDVRMIVATDLSEQALAEAKRRWTCRQSRWTHEPVASFEVLDMNVPLERNTWAQAHAQVFHAASCHFAAHYFADSLPAFASAVLRPKGKLALTMFDRPRVVEFLRDKPQCMWTFGEDRANGPIASLRLLPGMNEVEVFVDTIGRAIVEHLWDTDVLCARFAEANMWCTHRVCFADIPGDVCAFPATHPLREMSNLYVLMIFEKDDVELGSLS